MLLLHIMFSHSGKIHCGAKRKLTTCQLSRQSRLLLVWNKVSAFTFCHFVRNSNKKTQFCSSLMCLDRSLLRPSSNGMWTIVFSYLLEAWNKHVWTYFTSTVERRQYTQFFKFKSTEVKLFSPDVFVRQVGGFNVMIGHIACQSSSLSRVNYDYRSPT